MHKLADLQKQFKEICLSPKISERPETRNINIIPTDIAAAQKVFIYCNNVQSSLKHVLEDDFKLTGTLIGQKFFHQILLKFIHMHPPLKNLT